MSGLNRRTMLRGAGLTVAGLATAQGIGAPSAVTAEAGGECVPPLGPVVVGPEDLRYQDLVRRGHKRYVAKPDYVCVVGSAEQVEQALRDAVRAGKKVAVRSGGHCLSDFVDNPAVRAIIDLSGMRQVYFDRQRGAFAIEGGALLGDDVYRRLFLGWGVTIPAGWCPRVGVGGHICGGGYGVLSRIHGLTVDYVEAVEVVVVGKSGEVRTVVATRDEADPHHDLWWAHTGGAGGNFGIVTKYWLKTPGATGTDPTRLLPRAPESTLDFSCEWPSEGMDEKTFARLMDNHSRWIEANSAPGAPGTQLYCELILHTRDAGRHLTLGQAFGPNAEHLLDDYLAKLSEGVGTPKNLVRARKPYLATALAGSPDSKPFRLRAKSGYLRAGFTANQIRAIYRQLAAPHDGSLLNGSVGLASYGGRINAVDPAATAFATRDAVIKLTYVSAWDDPAKDAIHDAWIREFYRNVYAETGGVPDPRDGAYINYPDNDLADPAINTSGIPWSTLYYKGNYPRLQKIKARWDPRDVFNHALAIRPPA
ncbi:BBE domain-containing protein [Amycolatopsis sp. NPDC051071]|uniref:FAD-binding oxidoreductase n=1 Tax=Amycolatopsis sp. NPDC051071 TaxID=3154637 RepID=UPI0034380910